MIVPTAPTLEGRRIVDQAGACEKVPGERGSMPMVSANGTAVVE